MKLPDIIEVSLKVIKIFEQLGIAITLGSAVCFRIAR
jgi:hypothetical protein